MKAKTILSILVGFTACGQTEKKVEKANNYVITENASYILKDTAVKIVWRTAGTDTLKDMDGVMINEAYLKTISDPESAALNFSILGEEDGNSGYISKLNPKFQVLVSTARKSGSAAAHAEFLKEWFRNDIESLSRIDAGPQHSYTRRSIDEIRITVKGDIIKVRLSVNAVSMLMGKSWSYTKEKDFKFEQNSLRLVQETSTEEEL